MKKFKQYPIASSRPQANHSPQIRLQTRRKSPISSKIRDDFYSFDSQPRFYSRVKLYDPDKKHIREKSQEPANWERLFSRTSSDGFNGRKKLYSPSPRKNESAIDQKGTPKFHGKKKFNWENDCINQIFINKKGNNESEDKNKFNNEENKKFGLEVKTGKKVMRMDPGFKVFENKEKIKQTAYKNYSNVKESFNIVKPSFITEYSSHFKKPELDAYYNEYSPFKC